MDPRWTQAAKREKMAFEKPIPPAMRMLLPLLLALGLASAAFAQFPQQGNLLISGKALGLVLPQAVLLRVDEVIE